MKIRFLYIALILVLFCACKKSKPVTFIGQLLLAKKSPVPISNRSVEIYQGGGSGFIFGGSSGSSSTTSTDLKGYFSMKFVPGTSVFLGVSSENVKPLTFSSEDGFPRFVRRNFPEPGHDATKPIYIGKTIDTVIIKVLFLKKITPSDTLGVQANTLTTRFDKKYTGLAADSAKTIVIDTIYNVIFTDFDCITNTYVTNSVDFGRIKRIGSRDYLSGSRDYLSERNLPVEDEVKREILISFYEW